MDHSDPVWILSRRKDWLLLVSVANPLVVGRGLVLREHLLPLVVVVIIKVVPCWFL
jgi:hypothetical protein